MTYQKIIVEIPHQQKASAWTAYSDGQIIDMASQVHGLIYEKSEKQDLIDCFGEWEDVPKEAKDIVEKYGYVFEIGYGNESEYIDPENAESEIDVAIEAIGHDLSGLSILTISEARDFLAEKNNFHIGHKYFEAMSTVREVMKFHEPK